MRNPFRKRWEVVRYRRQPFWVELSAAPFEAVDITRHSTYLGAVSQEYYWLRAALWGSALYEFKTEIRRLP